MQETMMVCDMQQPLHHVLSLLHTCTSRSSATSKAAAESGSAFVALLTAAVCADASPLLLLPSDAAVRGGMCQAAAEMTPQQLVPARDATIGSC
jgi:hypothetical protein